MKKKKQKKNNQQPEQHWQCRRILNP